MADTLPNIECNKDELINVYTASGISVGTAVQVSNVGLNQVALNVSSTGANLREAHILLSPGETARNETGDSGLFAMSHGNTTINVSEV